MFERLDLRPGGAVKGGGLAPIERRDSRAAEPVPDASGVVTLILSLAAARDAYLVPASSYRFNSSFAVLTDACTGGFTYFRWHCCPASDLSASLVWRCLRWVFFDTYRISRIVKGGSAALPPRVFLFFCHEPRGQLFEFARPCCLAYDSASASRPPWRTNTGK